MWIIDLAIFGLILMLALTLGGFILNIFLVFIAGVFWFINEVDTQTEHQR